MTVSYILLVIQFLRWSFSISDVLVAFHFDVKLHLIFLDHIIVPFSFVLRCYVFHLKRSLTKNMMGSQFHFTTLCTDSLSPSSLACVMLDISITTIYLMGNLINHCRFFPIFLMISGVEQFKYICWPFVCFLGGVCWIWSFVYF